MYIDVFIIFILKQKHKNKHAKASTDKFYKQNQ